MIKSITPFLWFDNQAEEAAKFYVSLFENSKIVDVSRYTEAGPGEPGSAMTVEFELAGQSFIALNGGPQFTFSPAISFSVSCETQEEVDRLWEAFSEGGQPNQCAWITDKYGVTWQIVPTALPRLLSDPDREKAARVMEAMFAMTKIDIAGLERAAAAEAGV
jgi:predicted 3-demethylubiquinone-9 3-methyltransferase (glyoxalase superfamily)